jgi:hypothetical protein
MTTEVFFNRPRSLLQFEVRARGFGACEGEIARAYSPEGTFILELRNFCSASLSEDDRKAISGQILTISHPQDTSFSLSELLFAAENRLAEIRAVGKSVIYSMKPERVWPGPGQLKERYYEIRSSREMVSRIEEIGHSEDFLSTSRDPAMDIFRIRRNLVLERLAASLGLVYRQARLLTRMRQGRAHANTLHTPGEKKKDFPVATHAGA